MDSFEWNKIIGSVLASLLFIVAVSLASQAIYSSPPLGKPAYVVPGVVASAGLVEATATAAAAETMPDFASAIPMANAMNGAMIVERCGACHDWTKGGPNKIGPNLWGITEEAMAEVPGYQFSAAMEAHKGEKWDPEKFNEWLWKPQALIKGTKMTFAGIPKGQDRADVIAYLETLK